MQNSRVIVCKLGRLGELRKIVDTNLSQIQEDVQSSPQEMESELNQTNNFTSCVIKRTLNHDLFSINQNFEDSTELNGTYKCYRYVSTHSWSLILALNRCCTIFDYISISASSNIKIAEETKKSRFTSELSKYFSKERQAREIFILKLNLNCLYRAQWACSYKNVVHENSRPETFIKALKASYHDHDRMHLCNLMMILMREASSREGHRRHYV